MSITVELTEQQARSVARAARTALRHDPYKKVIGPGDAAAGFRGCAILEDAVEKSVGRPLSQAQLDSEKQADV